MRDSGERELWIQCYLAGSTNIPDGTGRLNSLIAVTNHCCPSNATPPPSTFPSLLCSISHPGNSCGLIRPLSVLEKRSNYVDSISVWGISSLFFPWQRPFSFREFISFKTSVNSSLNMHILFFLNIPCAETWVDYLTCLCYIKVRINVQGQLAVKTTLSNNFNSKFFSFSNQTEQRLRRCWLTEPSARLKVRSSCTMKAK